MPTRRRAGLERDCTGVRRDSDREASQAVHDTPHRSRSQTESYIASYEPTIRTGQLQGRGGHRADRAADRDAEPVQQFGEARRADGAQECRTRVGPRGSRWSTGRANRSSSASGWHVSDARRASRGSARKRREVERRALAAGRDQNGSACWGGAGAGARGGGSAGSPKCSRMRQMTSARVIGAMIREATVLETPEEATAVDLGPPPRQRSSPITRSGHRRARV